MDELIKMLDSNLVYLGHYIKDDRLIISAESKNKEVKCPFCGEPSTRVHSIYNREFQDLPVMDKKVTIELNTRKMFCDNPDCNHKTFAERFNFISYKARKSERLIHKILDLSASVSSVMAAELIKEGTATVGKSTICSLLKKNASSCG